MKEKFFWRPLEHKVKQILSDHLPAFAHQHVIILCSGGADSTALLALFARLRAWHECTISVLHVHHGEQTDPLSREFRDQSAQHVRGLCERFAVELFLAQSPSKLSSEDEMREFRRDVARNLQMRLTAPLLLTGHHCEDLLETRLLRLLRGTGPQGLESMAILSETHMRPFLQISSRELREYLVQLDITWCEDPSNKSQDYLRNFLRHRFLPELEARSPGATDNMARSLELITQALQSSAQPPAATFVDGGVMPRLAWLALPISSRKQVLASYLLAQGVRDFRHTTIEEICKHLDSGQIDHTFKAAGLSWTVNARQISVS